MSENADRFRREGRYAGTTSKLRVDTNNQRRVKPKPELNFSPAGTYWKFILDRESRSKNQSIDQENTAIRKALSRHKGRAKQQFNDRTTESKGFGID